MCPHANPSHLPFATLRSARFSISKAPSRSGTLSSQLDLFFIGPPIGRRINEPPTEPRRLPKLNEDFIVTDQPARKQLDPSKRLVLAVAYINQLYRKNADVAPASQQARR